MNEELSRWETQIEAIAKGFTYPPTPNIVRQWQKRPFPSRTPLFQRPRPAWALIVLLVLGGLMAVPQVRAAVSNILRAGAITIFVSDETPLPQTAVLPATATFTSANTFLFDLAEPVMLVEAQQMTRFPLQLPTFPDGLGKPDQVYLSGTGEPEFVAMVWLDPKDPSRPILGLYHIEARQFAQKGASSVELAEVKGEQAFWIDSPHTFWLENGRSQSWLFVEGNVLLWWAGNVTYRLEGAASLEEAIRIAESLQPIE
jgi:hypothetical protein